MGPLEQLTTIFPLIDRNWIQHAISQYPPGSVHTVESITEKVLCLQFYPQQVTKNMVLALVYGPFPDIELSFARNLIAQSDHLYAVIDTLVSTNYPKRTMLTPLELSNFFRSDSYISSLRRVLLNRYPYDWNATITAVMAECNNDYRTCCSQLDVIPASILWTICMPWSRRKKGSIGGLDQLLQSEMAHVENDVSGDAELAKNTNLEQYAGELLTCKCCFDEVTFEDLVQCDHGHVVCVQCVEHTLTQGMYGIGNLRGKPLTCLASDQEKCAKVINEDMIKRAVSNDLFANYQATFFVDQMNQAGLEIAHCPYCNYMEEIPKYKLNSIHSGALIAYALRLIQPLFPALNPIIGLCFLLFLFFGWYSITVCYSCLFAFAVAKRLRSLLLKHRLVLPIRLRIANILRPAVKAPLILNCQNPKCLRVSCVECKKPWKAVHKCHEKERDSLRLHVELAMSQALIRAVVPPNKCPDCKIRFSKSDGCNKMTCPNCRKVTCYICRSDIHKEGYHHFCQHFRVIPGSRCDQCDRCDLYQVERDKVTVRKAAKKAKLEWQLENPAMASNLKENDIIGPLL